MLNQDKLIEVASGSWGGTGVGLLVEETIVTMEFDCAVGEIDRPLKTDSKGNFVIDGSYRRLSPGALRPNLAPKAQAARYEGRISGKTMKFKITATESKELIGEFTVERGKEPHIRKCR